MSKIYSFLFYFFIEIFFALYLSLAFFLVFFCGYSLSVVIKSFSPMGAIAIIFYLLVPEHQVMIARYCYQKKYYALGSIFLFQAASSKNFSSFFDIYISPLFKDDSQLIKKLFIYFPFSYFWGKTLVSNSFLLALKENNFLMAEFFLKEKLIDLHQFKMQKDFFSEKEGVSLFSKENYHHWVYELIKEGDDPSFLQLFTKHSFIAEHQRENSLMYAAIHKPITFIFLLENYGKLSKKEVNFALSSLIYKDRTKEAKLLLKDNVIEAESAEEFLTIYDSYMSSEMKEYLLPIFHKAIKEKSRYQDLLDSF